MCLVDADCFDTAVGPSAALAKAAVLAAAALEPGKPLLQTCRPETAAAWAAAAACYTCQAPGLACGIAGAGGRIVGNCCRTVGAGALQKEAGVRSQGASHENPPFVVRHSQAGHTLDSAGQPSDERIYCKEGMRRLDTMVFHVKFHEK